MIIHELDDDGVGLGSHYPFGRTRCGALGAIIIQHHRRHVRTESGAMFSLSLLQSKGDITDLFALELEPTTCPHCRRLAKRRTPRQVPVAP